MSVVCGTWMAQINVLLRILSVEVDVVCRLTQVWGARHARVSVGDIKPTRVACVPISVSLHGIGVRGLIVLNLRCGSGESRGSNDTLSGRADGGEDRWRYTCVGGR